MTQAAHPKEHALHISITPSAAPISLLMLALLQESDETLTRNPKMQQGSL